MLIYIGKALLRLDIARGGVDLISKRFLLFLLHSYRLSYTVKSSDFRACILKQRAARRSRTIPDLNHAITLFRATYPLVIVCKLSLVLPATAHILVENQDFSIIHLATAHRG